MIPAILAEELDPGLCVGQPGFKGVGLTGSSSCLQVQPGKLHSLLLIFDQVESMIQLIDNLVQILLVMACAISLQQ